MKMPDLQRTVMTAAVVAALGVSASPASAVPYTIGNIFASVGGGLVKEFTPTGTLVQTLNTGLGGFTTGSAFDASGNFYVTNFSANSVSKFNNTGVLQGPFGSGYATPESIVFDAAGNVYVGNVSSGGIRKFDAAGNLITALAAGNRVDWMDLAADQHTMLVTQEGTVVRRFDTITNTFGANFASGLTHAFALRILGDGSVLVADEAVIRHFNAAGTQILTYDNAGADRWFSLNLDPDGTTFWSGDIVSGEICRFNIATGAQVSCFLTGNAGTLYGISQFGEITVSNPPGAPEPATSLLIGSSLLGLAAMRRRKK